jgi:hypothetical protein
MKAFSPAQIKADLLFLSSIIATFGFNLTNTQTTILIGATGLITAAVNLSVAHIHVGKGITIAVEKVLTEVKGLLPAINALASSLPGAVGAEVRKVLETIEKGPGKVEVSTQDKPAKPAS